MTTLKSNLKLGKSIGSGHFGEVFLADDEVHGVVAVKVLERRPGETLIMWDTRKAGPCLSGYHPHPLHLGCSQSPE